MPKSNPKMRIALPVPSSRHPVHRDRPMAAFGALGGVRDWIIRTFQPRHQNVYAYWVTWKYGFRSMDPVPEYPHGLCDVLIKGIYRDENCDVLIVQVSQLKEIDGLLQPETLYENTPDGVPLHITLSCREGFEVGKAHRAVDIEKIEWLHGEFRPFRQSFRCIPAWTDMPTKNKHHNP